MVKLASSLVLFGLVAGCNVSSASESTGGVVLEGAPGGACARALLVAGSPDDYMSTNVSVLSPGGAVLSGSIISSASTAPGLTTALSGDVAFPSSAPTSGSLVLLDRSHSVLTWIDPSTALVSRQLSVATGFYANPHDYLEISPSKAYVSRYETNVTPGKEPNDQGGDVLVINPAAPDVAGRIDMAGPDDGAILPRASRLLRVGAQVWVSLQRSSADFKVAGDARIVGISTVDDTVAWSFDVPGASGCSGVAVSPSGAVVALACSSLLGDVNAAPEGTVVLLDTAKVPPLEIKRIATTSLGAALSGALAFISDTHLAGVAYGGSAAHPNDVVYTLDTTSGIVTAVAESTAPFKLGDMRCTPGCTNECLVPDAASNALRVFKIEGNALVPATSLIADTVLGLPPRSLGAL